MHSLCFLCDGSAAGFYYRIPESWIDRRIEACQGFGVDQKGKLESASIGQVDFYSA